MSYQKVLKFKPLIAVAGALLSIAIMRCSPLSLSQSKLHSVPGANSQTNTTPNNPTAATPIGGDNQLGPGSQTPVLKGIASSVHEYSAYLSEISTLPAEQKLTISSSSDSGSEVLESFKSTRSITIHFGGRTPDECRVYLGLSLSETMIANYGWNTATNSINTDCVAQQDGNWKISISAGVTQDTWALLSPSLQGFTIFVSSHPQMSVVNPSAPGSPGHGPNTPVRVTPTH